MPSDQLPSSDNDYTATSSNKLTAAFWNAALNSVGARLRTIEEKVATDLQDLIDAGTTDAIAVVTDNIAPQMAAIQATIDAASGDLAAAMDLLADLQVAGVDADKVSITAIAGLTALEAQAAFAEIITKLSDVDGGTF